MLIELLILLITAVVAYDYLSKKRRNDIMSESNIIGPRALPILGSTLMFVGKTPEDIFSLILKNRGKYGSMYRVWVFNRLALFSTDAKDVEVILSSNQHITKNSLYDMLVAWLGTGLLISTGAKWHSRRKVLTPAFHFKILEQFVEIFDQQSHDLVEILKDTADGRTAIDIYPFICRMALDIIAETSMGTKLNAQRNPNFGYVQAVTDITAILSNRFVKAWHRMDLLFKLTAPTTYKRQQAVIQNMHDFTENVIQERRKTLEKQLAESVSSSSENNDEIGSKKRMALLDVLLQAKINGKPLSNKDICEEVDTFMFEGHDTTTSGISFTLYLLAKHPEIQQKAFEEIREVIGEDTSRPITLHDLSNLNYLDCVIKEGLRMYPPIPMIGRRISEDIVLNGKKIPAGTDITIGIYVMLSDPKYFTNPKDFTPERHLAESTEKTNFYANIPFSAGPRNCIGQKFAILEMKSTISKMLRNFELLPIGPEVRPMMNLVTRSANGVHLGLKPRKY